MLVLVGLVACHGGASGPAGSSPPPPAPAPAPAAPAPAGPPRARPAATAAEVRALVAKLAEVDEAGIGFSPSVTGQQFLPVASADEQGMLLLGQAPPRRSPALTGLVEAGAVAVPVLLECLGDARPTQLPPMKAMMWSAADDEYDFNRRTGPAPAGVNRSGASPQPPVEHRVTVGDLCFVALGQIVNRGFSAVRYQPTGGLMINSPPASPPLRDAIRAEWGGLDERRLRASLARDFEQPDHASRRTGAAVRLGYYFPDALAPLLAAELARPTYDSDAVQRHVRSLYAADPATRARRFRELVDAGGPAVKDGILAALFQDLDGQEAYEQKRVSPPTSGSDYRARECLIELYGYPPAVKAADRPYPSYRSRYERERLIEATSRR